MEMIFFPPKNSLLWLVPYLNWSVKIIESINEVDILFLTVSLHPQPCESETDRPADDRSVQHSGYPNASSVMCGQCKVRPPLFPAREQYPPPSFLHSDIWPCYSRFQPFLHATCRTVFILRAMGHTSDRIDFNGLPQELFIQIK